MSAAGGSSREWLKLDAARAVEQMTGRIREIVLKDLKRKGVVLGLSGGVDSSVVAALAARALGKDRVVALLMPERESSDDSFTLARLVAADLGIATCVEDITSLLEAAGCYKRRDEMIRKLIPEYGRGYKCKIVMPALSNQKSYRIFSLVVESPGGKQVTARLTPETYRGIIAATNFKQRARKMMEYYHADRLHYAVAGTPNRLEYDQGFFVKNGDGAADLKPIAHLYKTQVYQLARYLELPEQVVKRQPTTDTYSLSQSQEEFYFSVPYDKMDLCLYGLNHGIPAPDVARAAGMTAEQVESVYVDIAAKRRATQYQHLDPLFVESLEETNRTGQSHAAR
jgi:NAD+ synthase